MHNLRHPVVLTLTYLFIALLALGGVAGSASANGGHSGSDYPELFSWPATPEEIGLPPFLGNEATRNPLPPIEIAPNYFLAEQGRNSLHGDTNNSDTLNYPAPLGIDPQVSSRQPGLLAATCPTVVFDAHGNVMTICIGVARVRLFLMDPDSLEVLAEHGYSRAEVAALRRDILRLRRLAFLRDSRGGRTAPAPRPAPRRKACATWSPSRAWVSRPRSSRTSAAGWTMPKWPLTQA